MLPAAQRRLWDELGATPKEFVLYGGTAIALRLGHRQSVDFDFFAFKMFDVRERCAQVPYLANAEARVSEPATLTCTVKRRKTVSLSFFSVPRLKPVRPPVIADPPGVALASMLDLAATKMAVVVRRAQLKDYLDIDAILERTDISLVDALAAGALFYGTQFNPMLTLKALTYFDDPGLAEFPAPARARLTRAVSTVAPAQIEVRAKVIKRSR